MITIPGILITITPESRSRSPGTADHHPSESPLGIGLAVLKKNRAGDLASDFPDDLGDLLVALERLREITSQKLNTLELIRGAKVFDRDRLYLVKPIGQRFWTETAALNDADEIVGTILMQTGQGVA